VLGHRLGYILVDGEEGLAGAPVHLAHELTAKCVDDTGDGGGLAFADEVEIEHALDGSWLQTVDEASCLVVEEGVFSTRAQRTRGSSETADVVVGREARRRSWGGSRHCEDDSREKRSAEEEGLERDFRMWEWVRGLEVVGCVMMVKGLCEHTVRVRCEV
jgi:hypothetical protein